MCFRRYIFDRDSHANTVLLLLDRGAVMSKKGVCAPCESGKDELGGSGLLFAHTRCFVVVMWRARDI